MHALTHMGASADASQCWRRCRQLHHNAAPRARLASDKQGCKYHAPDNSLCSSQNRCIVWAAAAGMRLICTAGGQGDIRRRLTCQRNALNCCILPLLVALLLFEALPHTPSPVAAGILHARRVHQRIRSTASLQRTQHADAGGQAEARRSEGAAPAAAVPLRKEANQVQHEVAVCAEQCRGSSSRARASRGHAVLTCRPERTIRSQTKASEERRLALVATDMEGAPCKLAHTHTRLTAACLAAGPASLPDAGCSASHNIRALAADVRL